MSADQWAVIKIKHPDGDTFYKLFQFWYGSFATGDSWKLNSGIESVTEGPYGLIFVGSSGSKYSVDVLNYGVTSQYGRQMIAQLAANIESVGGEVSIVPDSDWVNFEWHPK